MQIVLGVSLYRIAAVEVLLLRIGLLDRLLAFNRDHEPVDLPHRSFTGGGLFVGSLLQRVEAPDAVGVLAVREQTRLRCRESGPSGGRFYE